MSVYNSYTNTENEAVEKSTQTKLAQQVKDIALNS